MAMNTNKSSHPVALWPTSAPEALAQLSAGRLPGDGGTLSQSAAGARSLFTLEDEEEPFPQQLVRLSAEGSADGQQQQQHRPRGDTIACPYTDADGQSCHDADGQSCHGSAGGHAAATVTGAPTPTVSGRAEFHYPHSEPGGESPTAATATASSSNSSISSSGSCLTSITTTTAASAHGGMPSSWPLLVILPARHRGGDGCGARLTAGQPPAPTPTAAPPAQHTPSSTTLAAPHPPPPITPCADPGAQGSSLGQQHQQQPVDPGSRERSSPSPPPTPTPTGGVRGLLSPSLPPVPPSCGSSSSSSGSMGSDCCCGKVHCAYHGADVHGADAWGQCVPGSNARKTCNSNGSSGGSSTTTTTTNNNNNSSNSSISSISSMPCSCVGANDDAWEADARRQLEALRALRLSLQERLSRLAAPPSFTADIGQ